MAAASLPYQGNQGIAPRQSGAYPSPHTFTPTSPDDEAFRRGLRERAEEQRRRARDDGAT